METPKISRGRAAVNAVARLDLANRRLQAAQRERDAARQELKNITGRVNQWT